jgi:hypothetical protein
MASLFSFPCLSERVGMAPVVSSLERRPVTRAAPAGQTARLQERRRCRPTCATASLQPPLTSPALLWPGPLPVPAPCVLIPA